MVVLQQARQQVQRLRRAFLPILRGEENGPRLPRIIGNRTVVHHRHVQTVAVAVLPEILRAQHLADLQQLILVVGALEKRLATEELRSETHQQRHTNAPRRHPAENISSE